MKVKNFVTDTGGAARVTKMRQQSFEAASPSLTDVDPIGEVAREWHPGRLALKVTQIRPACRTGVVVRLERKDGKKLPPFYAGQYIVLEFSIGDSIVSRPYSISSAPFEARGERPFVEVTVRRAAENGFVCEYINRELKVEDCVTALMGCGQFYYEPLRDSRNVTALAGGTGITPFVSMAKEVAAGKLDIDLTILYGCGSSDDIVLKDELDRLQNSCEHVHVIYILSEKPDPGKPDEWTGERGFLTADLISKYEKPDSTFFICGPQVMYRFLREELKKLNLAPRRVRFEMYGPAQDISACEGYPQEARDKIFSLTVVRGIHEDTIPARACESLVTALERAGIRIETGCRSGECGFCRTKVLSGNYYVNPTGDGRRAADREFHYVHACSAYPVSDMKIRIPIA